VNEVGLFGSFVRDEQTRESDVDLLVRFEPGKKSFDNFMSLSTILEDPYKAEWKLSRLRRSVRREVQYVSLSS